MPTEVPLIYPPPAPPGPPPPNAIPYSPKCVPPLPPARFPVGAPLQSPPPPPPPNTVILLIK